MEQDRGSEQWETGPPAFLLLLALEEAPRALILCGSVSEEIRLLAWLEGRPPGLHELLTRLMEDPRTLFPWVSEAA